MFLKNKNHFFWALYPSFYFTFQKACNLISHSLTDFPQLTRASSVGIDEKAFSICAPQVCCRRLRLSGFFQSAHVSRRQQPCNQRGDAFCCSVWRLWAPVLEEGWRRIGLRCSRSTSRGSLQASPLYLLFHLLAALPSAPLTPGTTATCTHFFVTKVLEEELPSEGPYILWASHCPGQYVTRQILQVFATLPFSGVFSVPSDSLYKQVTASTPCRFPITINLSSNASSTIAAVHSTAFGLQGPYLAPFSIKLS